MKETFLPVRLQTTWLLTEARRVKEVLGSLPWLHLPRARAAVPGVVSWRARAVPVVDLAVFVPGLTQMKPAEPRDRTLIADTGGGMLALPVDAANEVVDVSLDAVQPQHATHCRVSVAEVIVRGEPMALLDWDMLVSELFSERGLGAERSAAPRIS